MIESYGTDPGFAAVPATAGAQSLLRGPTVAVITIMAHGYHPSEPDR